MSSNPQLLSELLRPQQLGDLTLPEETIQRLQRMVGSGRIMNLIFYGKPGIGKTSAARVIIETANGKANALECNGSLASGIDYVRDTLEKWASHRGMFGGPKICFVDEADGLSPAAQASLRCVIENKRHCRFLFTANNIGKLSPALQSRMMPLCFDIAPSETEAVVKRITARYEVRLSELGIKFDPKRLREVVGIYYPDFRAIANNLEFEFGLS
jgi:Straboviridae sliding clamp loader